jgi:hypothetical protein
MKATNGIIALVFAALLTADSASAQSPAPPNDSWRYKLQKVEDGFLRLDAQTGQVSHCKARDGSWVCNTAADDREALEAEIKRLSDRVATLEKQSNDPVNRFRTPSDQEIEQVMGFFEKMMKRFRGVVENLKKDWEADIEKKT